MAKPQKRATPEDRIGRWKTRWGTPRELSDEATLAAFDEFCEEFVPAHMLPRFVKAFGVPKAAFGNRFFRDDSSHRLLTTRISEFVSGDETHAEATILYALGDDIEATVMRGEIRRMMLDLFVDDWHCACAIIRTPSVTLYAFIEPKMRGCIIRSRSNQTELEQEPQPRLVEPDEEPPQD